jgi:hypothetical protein
MKSWRKFEKKHASERKHRAWSVEFDNEVATLGMEA